MFSLFRYFVSACFCPRIGISNSRYAQWLDSLRSLRNGLHVIRFRSFDHSKFSEYVSAYDSGLVLGNLGQNVCPPLCAFCGRLLRFEEPDSGKPRS